jgi:hypothetical protein
MKIYFAAYSPFTDLFKNKKETEYLLESFIFLKDKNFKEFHEKKGLLDRKLFVDSGAFSSFTMGKQLSISDYCDYIHKYKKYIEVYALMDVIGDYKKTEENLKYMESRGLNPLPVFHYGSPFSELEKLLEKYDYIALGGLVPLALQQPKLQAHLDKCFARIYKKYRESGKLHKIHGFGMTNFKLWKKYPFFSVDSTSWVMGSKYRINYWFEKNTLKRSGKNFKDRNLFNKESHNAHYSVLQARAVEAFLKAADFVTRLWEKRGITFR